jgi:hypothetical protein
MKPASLLLALMCLLCLGSVGPNNDWKALADKNHRAWFDAGAVSAIGVLVTNANATGSINIPSRENIMGFTDHAWAFYNSASTNKP